MQAIETLVSFLTSRAGTDVIKQAGAPAVDGPAPLDRAGSDEVTFCSGVDDAALSAIRSSCAGLLIADAVLLEQLSVDPPPDVGTLVTTANPRLDFARLVSEYFATDSRPPVFETAPVCEAAAIDESAAIGPGVTIGDSRVGPGCIINANVSIYDDVEIGDDTVVHAGTVIGSPGFGYERDEEGRPVPFPQRAGVAIGRGVEIGANTVIDRGALVPTVIGDRVKIDNLVHIAHNVHVGDDTMIAAGAVVGGSARIGRRVWVGPSAVITNGVTVGDGACVSLGAVVTRDVPEGQRVSGNFAVPHDRFIEFMRSIR